MIPVAPEEGAASATVGDAEVCALCESAFTLLWTTLPDREANEQVACCRKCAETKEPTDVPTKKAWFDRWFARRGIR